MPGPNKSFESVSPESLGNARRLVDEDVSASELNGIIDDISTDENGNGGTIELDPEITVTATDTVVYLKSDVLIKGNGATVKLADNLDSENAPHDSLITFWPDVRCENAHIRDLHIDGNIQNNDFGTQGDYDRDWRGGILAYAMRRTEDTNLTNDEGGSWKAFPGNRPFRCSIKNVTVENTVGSNIYWGARNSVLDTVHIKNSAADQGLYATHPVDCVVRDIFFEGHFKNHIRFGSTFDWNCTGNLIDGVNITDIIYDDGTHNPLQDVIEVTGKPNDGVLVSVSGETDEWYGNRITNVSVETDSNIISTSSSIDILDIDRPMTIDEVSFSGPIVSSIFLASVFVDDVTLSNVRATITEVESSPSFSSLIRDSVGYDGLQLENITVVNETSETWLNVISLLPGDNDITNTSIENLTVKGPVRRDINLRDGTGVVRGATIRDCNISTEIDVNSTAEDTDIENVPGGVVNDNGVRTRVDGWGQNAGDPNTTGDWSGEGEEGAAVVDTTNSVKYVYRGGSWV